jgi:hypothetical protein
MKTIELQQRILEVLKEGRDVTAEQLLGLLNGTYDEVRATKLGLPRLRKILVEMLRAGRIDRAIKPAPDGTRYRLPLPPTYSLDPKPSGHSFRVLRAAPGSSAWIIGQHMTEGEARCCVTALNELDRKVRAIKGR